MSQSPAELRNTNEQRRNALDMDLHGKGQTSAGDLSTKASNFQSGTTPGNLAYATATADSGNLGSRVIAAEQEADNVKRAVADALTKMYGFSDSIRNRYRHYTDTVQPNAIRDMDEGERKFEADYKLADEGYLTNGIGGSPAYNTEWNEMPVWSLGCPGSAQLCFFSASASVS